MPQNDYELITAVLSGEVHRFGEIVNEHDQLVRSIVGRSIPDWATREDLVQETFYRAFKNLDRLDSPDQFAGWLATITRNCLNDYFRRVARKKQREESRAIQKGDSQSKAMSSDWIWDEAKQLPGKYDSVLWLKYQMNMSYAEMALQLDLPVSTVRGRVFEARQALKKRLIEKGLYPDEP